MLVGPYAGSLRNSTRTGWGLGVYIYTPEGVEIFPSLGLSIPENIHSVVR